MPLDIDALMRRRSSGELSVMEIDEPLLRELRPDLIVTHAPEHTCVVTPVPIEEIASDIASQPTIVHMSPRSLDDVMFDLERLGRITERPVAATRAIERARKRGDAVRRRAERLPVHPEILFLEWIEPLCLASPWNAELLNIAGGRDAAACCCGTEPSGPTITDIQNASPDLVVVAACGTSFMRAMWEWEALAPEHPLTSMLCAAEPVVCFLDGQSLFKHPGPRLIAGLEQLGRAVEGVSRSKTCATAHGPA